MSGSRSTATMRAGGGSAAASAAVSAPRPASDLDHHVLAVARADAAIRPSTRAIRAESSAPQDFLAARPCRASTRRGSSLAAVKTTRAAALESTGEVEARALPPHEERAPLGSDHRRVVGAAFGRRNEETEAVLARGDRERRAQSAGSPPLLPQTTRAPRRSPRQRATRLAHQHIHDRGLKAGAKVGQGRALRDPGFFRAGSRPPS